MKNIIRACSYVAGVDSLGMRSLKGYHTELTDKQIEALDPLNVNQGILYGYTYKPNKAKTGTRFEGEKEGGEISIFDEGLR
ncbi:hypothetical protein [Lactococcus lactis]|uniref:Uncharacterized protein n=1 Tax=Lactococcus lactis TaxID=1358 RepID=A0AB35KD94_9LACT|nr:hypothetical protein [Lactococcus lactis]MDG4979163.1 hypothetical protein [Lactococcus lactis]MDG5048886.1 hypothetical protein [Lactococcus lactis]MDY4364011.1 hypothetical protein [Lactococcus lactis subsp. lactis]OSP87935.1 hypothetical protein B9W73_03510 [Lactococcus lactis]